MNVKNFFRYWFPFLFYTVLVFYISSLPNPPGTEAVVFSFDKILHVLEFAGFAFLLLRLLKHKRVRNPYVYAVVLTILYGVLDEFHQSFVPNRVLSGWDILSDSIGAFSVLIFKKFRKLRFFLK
jgi:VanZ family protein